MTKSELKEQAMRLPEDERLELGQFLLDSALPPLTSEQEALIKERFASYESDPGSWLTEEEFRSRLADRLSKTA